MWQQPVGRRPDNPDWGGIRRAIGLPAAVPAAPKPPPAPPLTITREREAILRAAADGLLYATCDGRVMCRAPGKRMRSRVDRQARLLVTAGYLSGPDAAGRYTVLKPARQPLAGQPQ